MKTLLEWAIVLAVLILLSAAVHSFVMWDLVWPWEWGVPGRVWAIVLSFVALNTVKD